MAQKSGYQHKCCNRSIENASITLAFQIVKKGRKQRPFLVYIEAGDDNAEKGNGTASSNRNAEYRYARTQGS
ncbi:MAG: hypothetical protein J6K55_13635, partial [Clostridia bacterium]|nr:hypothetical protein [Clostridia bacterium]